MATVHGSIRNRFGDGLPNVALTFFNKKTGEPIIRMSQESGRYAAELDPGIYVYVATEDRYLPETAEVTIPEDAENLDGPMIVLEENPEQGSPPVGSPPSEPPSVVEEFLDRLDDPDFRIDVPVSIDEVKQAISLFAIATTMLAGSSQYTRSSGEERIDMLGVITVYHGLLNKSLSRDLLLALSKDRDAITEELKRLSDMVDTGQGKIIALTDLAKRQFNLGTNNSILGNTEFPSLFRRYVDIGADPRLAVDLKSINENPFFEAKKPEVYDLLRDLKDIILKVVRSLSVYGTKDSKEENIFWAKFEKDALEVLLLLTQPRLDVEDDFTVWDTLALITQKPRDTIVPYVALARSGTNLLEYALAVYEKTLDKLDVYENSHLQDLFQPDGDEQQWFTTLIRQDAAIIKRYPLNNWG